MWVPSPRPATDPPSAMRQETGARLSSVHRNDVASPSIQLTVAVVGLVGVTVTVGELGAVVSTVHETVPGVGFRLPTASVAYTSTKWTPWLRPLRDNFGGVGVTGQSCAFVKRWLSTAHLKLTPVSTSPQVM